jgi:hypothetical protein
MAQEASNFFHRKKWRGSGARERGAGAGRGRYSRKKTPSITTIFFCFFSCHIIICHITYHAGVTDGDRHLFTRRFRLRVFSYSRNCRLRHGGRPVAGSSCGTRYTPSPSSQGRGAHTRSRFRRQDRRHSVRTCQT